MLDDADRQAEAVEDGAHPLRVALGQVVVDGDDVDAAAGHRVERGGERRDEGLALAGLHLRDPALVEDDAAHQLDVEGAHAQLATADLAGRGEDLGQDVVEDGLEVLGVLLLAGAAQLARGARGRRCSAPPRDGSERRGVLGDLARGARPSRSRICSSVSACVVRLRAR